MDRIIEIKRQFLKFLDIEKNICREENFEFIKNKLLMKNKKILYRY